MAASRLRLELLYPELLLPFKVQQPRLYDIVRQEATVKNIPPLPPGSSAYPPIPFHGSVLTLGALRRVACCRMQAP